MSNKYAFLGGSIYNKSGGKRLETTIFYYGKVVANTDELGANRVKVRIAGIDDTITTPDLGYAFPLVQKFVHVVPKIGEMVLVFIPDVKNPHIDRMYVGPIISQPQMLNGDKELFSSTSTLDSGIREPRPSPDTIPENRGVYPSTEDIAIQGRNNSDLIFRDKEAIIRAGQSVLDGVEGEIPKFNKVDPSYIQLKYDVVLKKGSKKTEEERGSVVNVVGNKINLLTHKDGSPRFVLNDQDSTITEENLLKILNEAHPLVFGDKLLEYLELQRAAFINHVAPYPGMKPQDLAGSNHIDKYLEFDLNSILSKNIRIN